MSRSKIRVLFDTYRLRLKFNLRNAVSNAGEVVLVSTTVIGAVAGLLGILIKSASPIFFEFQNEAQSWKRRPNYIYVGSREEVHDETGGLMQEEESKYIEGIKLTVAKETKKSHTLAVPAARLLQWFRAKQSHNARTLVKLSKSDDPQVHAAAIESMAMGEDWTDADYVMMSQALDMRTAIELAHYPDIDIRFFRPPPSQYVCQKKGRKFEELREVLSSLPTTNTKPVTRHLTSRALTEGKKDDGSGAWSFGGVSLSPPESHIDIPAEKLEKLFLEALASHSVVPENCHQMVKDGILPLLQRVYQKRRTNMKIMHLIMRIVGNTSCHDDLHEDLYRSGWIHNLVDCSTHLDLEISTQAMRALHNLDNANKDFKLGPGVFMSHPLYRTNEPIVADVIFIHGLIGGAFKTWRQGGRVVISTPEEDEEEEVEDSEKPDAYTFSWPKDWLAKDIPNIRILTVEYESYLSKWSPASKGEPEKQSLKARSSEIFSKLEKAGVGSRPVIMIGHSMGGLLIKEMIVEHSDFSRQVVGCVFYGVPHLGSPLADSSSQTISRQLLYPSVEVTELKTDSPSLKLLNKQFEDFCSSHHVDCLSFGETRKTYVGLNVNVTLVPLESSNPGFGKFVSLDCNHLNVCKPTSKNSGLYTLTKQYIQDCLEKRLPCQATMQIEEEEKSEDNQYHLLF